MSKLPRNITVLLAVLLLGGGVGCSFHDVPNEIAAPVHIPASFSETGDQQTPRQWWTVFGDEKLDALIKTALADNLTLQAAWSRLDQAGAVHKRVGAALYPQVTGELSNDYQRENYPNPYFTRHPRGEQGVSTLALSASYELDMWTRVSSLKSAAEFNMLASEYDIESTAISLIGTLSDAWFTLIEQRAQERLLLAQIVTSQKFLELTELRFRQGQASALDVYQQRTQMANLRVQLPDVRARRKVLEHQISVLLGKPPGELGDMVGDELPEPPPLPATGVPVELLRRRPDIGSAHALLVAADFGVAAAVADRLPALRVGATGIYQSSDVGRVFDNWAWGLTSGIVQPIVDGGRRVAEVNRNKAVVQERLRTYGQTVLDALQDVEDALAQERQQVLKIEHVAKKLELAKATLEQARSRYVNGLNDYLPVLTALVSVQTSERELLTARRILISFRIQVYRSLAGGWAKDEAAPKGLPRPPVLPVTDAAGGTEL
jgi:NodT family efflux transporter outer membrane factor (OMF) lipoprotein